MDPKGAEQTPDTAEPGAAATRAAANTAKDEAGRTPAALLGRALQARFAAVARQAVVLGLMKAGAQEFTRIATADHAHGFPDGSDYGALFPQDDLSPAQVEAIFRAAGRAVQVEAEKMIDEAGDDLVVALIDQPAEWEEGAELEWAHLCEMRERMERENAEVDARQEAAAQEEAARKAAASGARYVAAYLLPGADTDAAWVAESLDAGALIACPGATSCTCPPRRSRRLGRRPRPRPRTPATCARPCPRCATRSTGARGGRPP